MNATVLLSGGIDSALCLHRHIRRGDAVRALFVDYGQPARVEERCAATRLAQHWSVVLESIAIESGSIARHQEVPGRNAFLIFTALLGWDRDPRALTVGVHQGSRYYDCSERFIADVSEIVTAYTEGVVQVAAPLLFMTKDEIVAECLRESVPIELTYSCQTGDAQSCGRCASCLDRKRLRI